jgi:hypothetical protein
MECPFCRTYHPKSHGYTCSRCNCSFLVAPDKFKRSKPWQHKPNLYQAGSEILVANPVQKADTDTPVYGTSPDQLTDLLATGVINQYEFDRELSGDYRI